MSDTPYDEAESELLEVFLTEANTKLENMDQLIVDVEKNAADKNLHDGIFRIIHTLKGNAGFFGLTATESIAHVGESLLSDLRDQKIAVTAELIDLLLEATEAIKNLIHNVESQGSEAGLSYPDLVERLKQARTDGLKAAGGTSLETSEEEDEDDDDLSDVLIIGSDDCPDPSVLSKSKEETPPKESAPPPKPPEKPAEPPKRAKRETTIRVSVDLIQSLMNEVGELVLARNQIIQHVSNQDLEALEMSSNALDHVTSRLQENMMKTRLQPVSNVFNKFPRVVRELARTSGKKINFAMDGQTTEVDKTLLEAIEDPLTHIIRNAVDHAIETPDERENANKEKEGNVSLKAYHEGEHVVISIKDDGRGIDKEKIKSKAIEKGLITTDEAERLSDKQAIHLIMHAGFSTAEKITNISGRGVGMDVVKSEIEKVNGIIDIDTQLGKGTEFKLEIPLTLAIIPTLIIMVGDKTYAIPQVNTVEVMQHNYGQYKELTETLKSSQFIQFRGEWTPVVYLSQILNQSPQEEMDDEDEISIVVVRSGTQQIGLVVDQVIDSEEIVVKPLLSQLQKIGCFAGTTILGNGAVTLILDIAGILRKLNIQKVQEEDNAQQEMTGDVQPLLICSNDKNQKIAVPLILVSRIEEIQIKDIQILGDREVIPFEGSLLRLIRPEKHLPITSEKLDEVTQVLVFDFNSKRIGLIIGQVVDSIEYQNAVDESVCKEDGILGSIMLENEGILLIDIYKLIELEDANWFQNIQNATEENDQINILIAEDSDFFRNLCKNYLLSAGYNVIEGEDGEKALELFQSNKIDLVLTDIEMPNMNGFELCTAIRNLPNGQDMPILALTTLTSEQSREKAFQVGMDEYLVKISREDILFKVAEHMDKGKINGSNKSASQAYRIPNQLGDHLLSTSENNLDFGGHSKDDLKRLGFVTFCIENDLYGIPINQVQEVMIPKDVASVPLADTKIQGIMNLRGQVLTVFDMRKSLGYSDFQDDYDPISVVVNHKNMEVSLLVDEEGEYVEVKASTFKPPPPTVEKNLKGKLQGVCELSNNNILMVLDVDAILENQNSRDNTGSEL